MSTLNKPVCVFDSSSPEWHKNKARNHTFLRTQENYLSFRLNVMGHVFLNEVFDCLGLPRTPEGQRLGWLYNETPYVSFGLPLDSNDDNIYTLTFNVSGEIWDKI